MADIYFICDCAKVIAADSAGVNVEIRCPDCGHALVVPTPDISCHCEKCGEIIFAPQSMLGNKVSCLKCHSQITVSAEYFNCPVCAEQQKQDAVICSHCGCDFKTGATLRSWFALKRNAIVACSAAFVLLSVVAVIFIRPKRADDSRSLNSSSITTHYSIASQSFLTSTSFLTEPSRSNASPALVADNVLTNSERNRLRVEEDTRSLRNAISSVLNIDNYTYAVDVLSSSLTNYPCASNKNEAESLLSKYRQGMSLAEVIVMCGRTNDYVSAIAMLRQSADINRLAPNRSAALALIAKDESVLEESASLGKAISDSHALSNATVAIQYLQDAIRKYGQATNTLAAHELLAALRAEQLARAARKPRNIYDDVKYNLVFIERPHGAGNGFVVNSNGKKYIVTNRHVINGSSDIVLKSLTGEQPHINGFDIAEELDLVRFEIDNSFPAQGLCIETNECRIGDALSVFGNSEGQGALTEIKGEITGIGPRVIETTAGFVRGNSGSPIVNSNGNVVGVASFVTKADPADWTIEDTRLDKPRRFGYRLGNIRWVPVNFREFSKQSDILREADSYLMDLTDIVIVCCFDSKEQTYMDTCKYYSSVSKDAAKERSRWSYDLREIIDAHGKYKQGGGLSGSVNYERMKMYLAAAPIKPKDILTNTKWIDKYYGDTAKAYLKYISRLTQELKPFCAAKTTKSFE